MNNMLKSRIIWCSVREERFLNGTREKENWTSKGLASLESIRTVNACIKRYGELTRLVHSL